MQQYIKTIEAPGIAEPTHVARGTTSARVCEWSRHTVLAVRVRLDLRDSDNWFLNLGHGFRTHVVHVSPSRTSTVPVLVSLRIPQSLEVCIHCSVRGGHVSHYLEIHAYSLLYRMCQCPPGAPLQTPYNKLSPLTRTPPVVPLAAHNGEHTHTTAHFIHNCRIYRQ